MTRLGIALGVMLAALASVAGPAAATGGACSTSSGVTVVVNFGSLGGGTVVRCAQTGGSGLDALRAAGFSTEGTQRDGGAFVCRLDGKPSAASENCASTPPVAKSWRYWYADSGGTWKYSQSGAGSRNVVKGGFEGWSFGGGSTPGVAPVRSVSSGSSAGTIDSSPGSAIPEGPSSTEDENLPGPKPRTAASALPPPRISSATTDDVGVESSGDSAAPWVAGAVILALVAALAIRKRSSRSVNVS